MPPQPDPISHHLLTPVEARGGRRFSLPIFPRLIHPTRGLGPLAWLASRPRDSLLEPGFQLSFADVAAAYALGNGRVCSTEYVQSADLDALLDSYDGKHVRITIAELAENQGDD